MSKEEHPRKRYPSDLTDEQWAIVAPMIPLPHTKRGGRPRTVDMREVVNTMLYLNRSGCQWDMLPHDLLPKSTVYDYFAQWRDDGTWTRLVQALREQIRVQAGREPTPSAACIDSQSVKTTEIGGAERGYDGVCFRRACVIYEASSVYSVSMYTPHLEAPMKTIPPTQAEQHLTHVADRFDHWRQTRTTPAEPIPHYLWEQAIALTTTFSITRVATRLRVSGGELKKRCAAHHAALTAPVSAPPGFVEVPAAPAWFLPTLGIEIELQRPDGARLRIATQEPQLPLTALVRAFLETPPCSS